MKLKKFAYLYSKLLGNHTLKIIKNTWKFTLKNWKNHGILSVRKCGNPAVVFMGTSRNLHDYYVSSHFSWLYSNLVVLNFIVDLEDA